MGYYISRKIGGCINLVHHTHEDYTSGASRPTTQLMVECIQWWNAFSENDTRLCLSSAADHSRAFKFEAKEMKS